MKVIEWLNGKKTYILAGIGFLVFGADLLGYIDREVANSVYAAVGLGGLATLRMAIRK